MKAGLEPRPVTHTRPLCPPRVPPLVSFLWRSVVALGRRGGGGGEERKELRYGRRPAEERRKGPPPRAFFTRTYKTSASLNTRDSGQVKTHTGHEISKSLVKIIVMTPPSKCMSAQNQIRLSTFLDVSHEQQKALRT